MRIDTIPFPSIARRVGKYWNPFEYNPHQGFWAATRGGKSYLIRHGLLPLVPYDRVVILDVKPGGARTWNEWGNDVTELKPGFGCGPDGTPHYRMLLQSGDAGKTQVARFIDMISNEGSCIVVIDDSRKITSNTPGYGMREHVDELLTIGAEIGVTAILAANSTVWATSSLRDQCGIYWIGLASSNTEQKRFANIAGLPNEARPYLAALKPRQFLYSDRYDGEIRMAITEFAEAI